MDLISFKNVKNLYGFLWIFMHSHAFSGVFKDFQETHGGVFENLAHGAATVRMRLSAP